MTFPSDEKELKEKEEVLLNDKLEIAILEAVENSSGIKSVELAMKVIEKLFPLSYDSRTFMKIVDDMAANGTIIEVEYSLPAPFDQKIRSLYFPVGTKFNFTNCGTL